MTQFYVANGERDARRLIYRCVHRFSFVDSFASDKKVNDFLQLLYRDVHE